MYVTTKRILSQKFGTIVLESNEAEWVHSNYYENELGWPTKRQFILFGNLINPEDIPEIKLLANDIEKTLSEDSKRKVNIDPGYLTLSKVVLVTTKNYAHRICLRSGIYAEVTLIYQKGTYQPHLFTYPDYREPQTIQFLLKARQILKNKIRSLLK